MTAAQIVLDTTPCCEDNAALCMDRVMGLSTFEKWQGLLGWSSSYPQVPDQLVEMHTSSLEQFSVSPRILVESVPVYAYEETWIDEPFPHRPLEAKPITVRVKDGGWGKPRFRVETLVSIYDTD